MNQDIPYHLPDISITDNLQEALGEFILSEVCLEDTSDLSHVKRLITYEEIVTRLGLQDNSPFAIASHILDYASTEHKHDFIEIVFPTVGKAHLLLDGKPTVLSAGELAIIPIQTPHLLAPHPDSKNIPTIVNLLLHPDFASMIPANLFPETVFFKDEPYIYKENTSQKSHILNMLLNEYQHANYQLNLSVLGYLIILIQCIQEAFSNKKRISDSLTDEVLDYIKNRCGNCQLTDIAGYLNYSPNYLSRYIKKKTGLTVSQHIIQAKLNEAQRLLAYTKIPISEISTLVGYQSESHFFRVFKEQYELTPLDYRKLMKS